MLRRLIQKLSGTREVYFHEDDYCQQQLLPRETTTHAESELRKIDEFSATHVAPGGLGWTDVYMREEAPAQFAELQMKRREFDALVSPIFPAFDRVMTGYSSHREVCKRTAAWGLSQGCVMFADWSDAGVITNVWSRFFDSEEEQIRTAARVVAALGRIHPLVFVDWAWGYTCEATEEEHFAVMLRTKLTTIAEHASGIKKG
jgi:hypothetical protein